MQSEEPVLCAHSVLLPKGNSHVCLPTPDGVTPVFEPPLERLWEGTVALPPLWAHPQVSADSAELKMHQKPTKVQKDVGLNNIMVGSAAVTVLSQ